MRMLRCVKKINLNCISFVNSCNFVQTKERERERGRSNHAIDSNM